MIVRSYRFVDLESPVEYFNTWLTSVPHFFVRNHMHEPSELNTTDWRLSIGGEVEKPLTLSLAELSKLETHSVVNTLECAGNGRSLHRPQVPGVQWGKGAVSTARFSGPRLRDVLQRAGIANEAREIILEGADNGTIAEQPHTAGIDRRAVPTVQRGESVVGHEPRLDLTLQAPEVRNVFSGNLVMPVTARLGGQGVDEGAGHIFAPVVRQDCPDPHPVTAIEAQGLGDEAGRHGTAGCAEHCGTYFSATDYITTDRPTSAITLIRCCDEYGLQCGLE